MRAGQGDDHAAAVGITSFGMDVAAVEVDDPLGDREPETLEVLAERLGLTRERIRQIQQEALLKLKRRMIRHGVDRDSIF